MNSALLNFLGGLLAFLAVLIPLTVKGWRLAKKKGKHREILGFVFTVLALGSLVAAFAVLLFKNAQAPSIVLGGLALFLMIAGHLIEPGPPQRVDIVILTLMVSGFLSLASLALMLEHVKLFHPPKEADAASAPKPASSPSN